MKHIKRKDSLQRLVAVSLLAALLVSLNGCKKKPDATEPSSSGETTVETTEETTMETTAETTVETTVETTAEASEEVCAHVLSDWIVDVPSNCTKEGSRYKKCTQCDEKLEEEAIAKTAHTPGQWKDDEKEKATCTTQGKKVQKCSQCDTLLYTAAMDKTDHNAKTVRGYAATAARPGLTDGAVCLICDAEVQKSFQIPVVGEVPYITRVNGAACTIISVGSWVGEELILPAEIDGKTVTAIADNAFAGLTSVKTVYIPKAVKIIGDKAFSGCSALTNITYQGTTVQWSASVSKGSGWNENTGNYRVFCTNNSLAK